MVEKCLLTESCSGCAHEHHVPMLRFFLVETLLEGNVYFVLFHYIQCNFAIPCVIQNRAR